MSLVTIIEACLAKHRRARDPGGWLCHECRCGWFSDDESLGAFRRHQAERVAARLGIEPVIGTRDYDTDEGPLHYPAFYRVRALEGSDVEAQ